MREDEKRRSVDSGRFHSVFANVELRINARVCAGPDQKAAIAQSGQRRQSLNSILHHKLTCACVFTKIHRKIRESSNSLIKLIARLMNVRKREESNNRSWNNEEKTKSLGDLQLTRIERPFSRRSSNIQSASRGARCCFSLHNFHARRSEVQRDRPEMCREGWM